MTVTEFRKYVKEIVKYWLPIFGLSDWQITITFTERKDFATCHSQPEYEMATIHVNTRHLRRKSKEEILEDIVHEIAHIRTWEANLALDKLYPPIDDDDDSTRSELLTTAFARTVLRAYKEGFEQATAELEEEDDEEE
ncbi:MAG: hypothetical protein ACW99Q_00405 [Candidatus Kariarchaeaceae archaeon]|jgi:hypothetical protein